MVEHLVPRVSAAASGNDCWYKHSCRYSGYCGLHLFKATFEQQCCVDASGTGCSAWYSLRCGC